MNTNTQYVKIGKNSIPSEWVSNASFSLTKASAPILLITAERKDGFLEMYLYQKCSDGAHFLGQRCLQYHVKQQIAKKLSDAILVQLQTRRQIPNRTVMDIMKDFSTLFAMNPESNKIFRELTVLLESQNGISYSKVLKLMQDLTSTCEMRFTNYEHFFSYSGLQNPMLQLFNSMFMEWNLIMRQLGKFLHETLSVAGNDTAGQNVQLVFYGSVLSLLSILEPRMARSQVMQFTPRSNQLVYRESVEMLRAVCCSDQFQIALSAAMYPYEQVLQDAYAKNQKSRAESQKNTLIKTSIFTEKAYCLPQNVCAYAGSKNGTKIPIMRCEQPETEQRILIPPYSESFAAQVAEGVYRPLKEQWQKTEDGWEFTLEYAYKNEVYRIKPRLYRDMEMIPAERLPEIVFFKKKDIPMLCASAESDTYQTQLFHGGIFGETVHIPEHTSKCYLRLLDGHQFLMQFRVDLI